MQVLKRFKSPSTALLSIPIASYCSIKRLLDKRLNSPQIPAFRMTTGIVLDKGKRPDLKSTQNPSTSKQHWLFVLNAK